MLRMRSGTPTLITTRSALRSASGKRGWSSTPIQISSNAGKAWVQRSRSSWSSAVPASKKPTWLAHAPRVMALISTCQPPTWNIASGVQKRSPAPRPMRPEQFSPSASRLAWVWRQPLGLAVVPDV